MSHLKKCFLWSSLPSGKAGDGPYARLDAKLCRAHRCQGTRVSPCSMLVALILGLCLVGHWGRNIGLQASRQLAYDGPSKKNRLNTRLSWLVPCLSCPVPCCFSVQKKGLGSSSGRRSVANLKRAKEQGKRRGAMGWNSVFCICCVFLERSCSFFVPWFFGAVFFCHHSVFFSLSPSSFC